MTTMNMNNDIELIDPSEFHGPLLRFCGATGLWLTRQGTLRAGSSPEGTLGAPVECIPDVEAPATVAGACDLLVELMGLEMPRPVVLRRIGTRLGRTPGETVSKHLARQEAIEARHRPAGQYQEAA